MSASCINRIFTFRAIDRGQVDFIPVEKFLSKFSLLNLAPVEHRPQRGTREDGAQPGQKRLYVPVTRKVIAKNGKIRVDE